jgi:AraC-like DNA-binding protein
LLRQGVPILDVVDGEGFSDQAHLTRSLKRFLGKTPRAIARKPR